jgi:hypothetical protein
MTLKLPRGAEREYIAASNIHAVYVAALETGPSLVATSRDLLHSLIAIRRRWMGAIISCAYWMQQKSDARLIVRQVYDELGHSDEGLLVAHAKTAQRKVENVAAHMGITLTEHDVVLMRAKSAVASIEGRIDELQQTGGLREFNKSYRAWRLQAQQIGRGMSYREARSRLRQKIFRELLSDSSQQLSQQLFPPLPGIDFPV